MVAEPRDGGGRGGRRRVTHLRRLDHVAVLVRSTDEALEFYAGRLGLRVHSSEVIEQPHVRLTYLDAGNMFLQFVEPLDGDSPLTTVARGARRGPASPVLRRRRRRDRRGRAQRPGRARCARERPRPGLELPHGGGQPRRAHRVHRVRPGHRCRCLAGLPSRRGGRAPDSQPNDPFGRKGTMTCVS